MNNNCLLVRNRRRHIPLPTEGEEGEDGGTPSCERIPNCEGHISLYSSSVTPGRDNLRLSVCLTSSFGYLMVLFFNNILLCKRFLAAASELAKARRVEGISIIISSDGRLNPFISLKLFL